MSKERQVSWWYAITNLPHSPLLHYLSTAHQRRQARASGVKRNLLFWLALFYLAAMLIMCFDAVVLNDIPLKSVFRIVLAIGACLGLIYYLIALARTVYITIIQALRFLAGDSPQSQTEIRLDDHIALLPIGSREILVALLARLWPPLILLSLGAGLLTWAFAGFAYFHEEVFDLSFFSIGADAYNLLLKRLVVWAPVTIGSITLSGSLSSLIVVLWSVTMGRGTTNRLLQSLFAGIVVLVNLVANPLAGYFSLLYLRLSYKSSYPDPIWERADAATLSVLIVIGLVWLGTFVLMWLANRGKRVPTGWAFSPIVVVVLVVLLPLALRLLMDSVAPVPPKFAAISMAFNLSPAAILIGNPLALPTVDLLGLDILEWATPYRYYQYGGLVSHSSTHQYPLEWFRFPLLLLQQLGMVLIGMFFAVRAIEKRRRGFE